LSCIYHKQPTYKPYIGQDYTAVCYPSLFTIAVILCYVTSLCRVVSGVSNDFCYSDFAQHRPRPHCCLLPTQIIDGTCYLKALSLCWKTSMSKLAEAQYLIQGYAAADLGQCLVCVIIILIN